MGKKIQLTETELINLIEKMVKEYGNKKVERTLGESINIIDRRILNEALNKDMSSFGKDLGKYFTNDGFDVKYLNNRITDEQLKYVRTNKNVVALELSQTNETQSLSIFFNSQDKSKIDGVVNKFQLTPYNGKILQRGWTSKQVQGAINPGDIYKLYDDSMDAYYFYRVAKTQPRVKNV